MSSLRIEVARAALAVSEPLDLLGSPCLVVGPRNPYSGLYSTVDPKDTEGGTFHRVTGVYVDIFKNWHEPFNRVYGRFAKVQATGSTPLEDGIQYALQELSGRPERHRVVLVVTDGCPDNSAVCLRQIRLAAEAGVHVIGVGISSGCSMVTQLFPEHVVVDKLAQLPQQLLKTLEGIMFPKIGGKKVVLDGNINKRFVKKMAR